MALLNFLPRCRHTVLACIAALIVLATFSPKLHVSAGVTKEERLRICGTDTDCVRVRASSEAQMVIDGLDLNRDTPADVLKRLPSWFGPSARRRVLRASNHAILDMKATLGSQNVQLGDALQILVVKDEVPDEDL